MAAPMRKFIASNFRPKSSFTSLIRVGQVVEQRQICKHDLVNQNQSQNSQDEKSRSENIQWILSLGTGLSLSLVVAGYELRKRQNISEYFENLRLLPAVQAARIVDNDDVDSHAARGGVHHEGGPPHHFNFIADTVEKSAPAVVYIEIKGRHPFSNREATVSNGSGFIVKSDGLILTNAHVVANKHTVQVTLNDGRKFEGVVQAVDPVTDLATVRIPATKLPHLDLADSSCVRPGEWVVAMGSPLSLSNTVTAGIVSTVHRGSKELGLHNKGDMAYIQTDAVINFGNSGGPLVNLEGKAIGISSMKVTTGISFAIPSNYAREFLDKAQQLESRKGSKGGWFGGKSATKRRYIGVTMLTLTPSIAAELKNRMEEFPRVESGVFVHKVVVGSPAYNGGIRPGDVVFEINRRTIQTATDVYKALETTSDLNVKIIRGRDVINLHIEAEEVN